MFLLVFHIPLSGHTSPDLATVPKGSLIFDKKFRLSGNKPNILSLLCLAKNRAVARAEFIHL